MVIKTVVWCFVDSAGQARSYSFQTYGLEGANSSTLTNRQAQLVDCLDDRKYQLIDVYIPIR
jgi:hypothetical protein